MVGSTVGQFAMVRRWAVARRGATEHAMRRRCLAGSGRKKGVPPPGWASWATQADWPTGPIGPKARKEFFRI
jgi:hypothetical protein